MPILSSEISTEDLINDYKQAHSRFKVTEDVLKQRAIEESSFKVGDIIKVVPGPTRVTTNEYLVSRIEGRVHPQIGNGVKLAVDIFTRGRLKSGGWHKNTNEQYLFDLREWQVVGHEDIKEQP